MNYIQIIIPSANEAINEMLIAELSAIGFDGFEETENVINAFIEENNLIEDKLQVILNKKNLPYQKQIIKKQNWNKLWESNFDTVMVDDFVGIRAEFHEPIVGVEYEIVITPKMSFGTGHHATTFMMMKLMQIGEVSMEQDQIQKLMAAASVLPIRDQDFAISLINKHLVKLNT